MQKLNAKTQTIPHSYMATQLLKISEYRRHCESVISYRHLRFYSQDTQ